MFDIRDIGQPVKQPSADFSAWVQRFPEGHAMVRVFRRPDRYRIDFAAPVAEYETLSKGAAQSARREVRKLMSA